MERSEALTLATTWMDLEHMVSERNQAQKATKYVITFMRNVQNRQSSTETGNGFIGARDWGKRRESDDQGVQGFFWDNENVLKSTNDSCTPLRIY